MGGEGGEGGAPSWPTPSDLPSEDGSGHLDYPEGFEEIWSAYPRHRGKKAAYRKIRSLVRNGSDLEDLQEAARQYAARMEAEGRDPEHVKLARTFYGPDDWWREELEKDGDDVGSREPDYLQGRLT